MHGFCASLWVPNEGAPTSNLTTTTLTTMGEANSSSDSHDRAKPVINLRKLTDKIPLKRVNQRCYTFKCEICQVRDSKSVCVECEHRGCTKAAHPWCLSPDLIPDFTTGLPVTPLDSSSPQPQLELKQGLAVFRREFIPSDQETEPSDLPLGPSSSSSGVNGSAVRQVLPYRIFCQQHASSPSDPQHTTSPHNNPNIALVGVYQPVICSLYPTFAVTSFISKRQESAKHTLNTPRLITKNAIKTTTTAAAASTDTTSASAFLSPTATVTAPASSSPSPTQTVSIWTLIEFGTKDKLKAHLTNHPQDALLIGGPFNHTTLYTACHYKKTAHIKVLLRTYNLSLINHCDDARKETALHIACQMRLLKAAELLVAAGADIYATNRVSIYHVIHYSILYAFL